MVKQLKIKILVNAFVLWYDGLHESLDLNSAYNYIYRNLSMIASMTEIQESKFANITFFDVDIIWARSPN